MTYSARSLCCCESSSSKSSWLRNNNNEDEVARRVRTGREETGNGNGKRQGQGRVVKNNPTLFHRVPSLQAHLEDDLNKPPGDGLASRHTETGVQGVEK